MGRRPGEWGSRVVWGWRKRWWIERDEGVVEIQSGGGREKEGVVGGRELEEGGGGGGEKKKVGGRVGEREGGKRGGMKSANYIVCTDEPFPCPHANEGKTCGIKKKLPFPFPHPEAPPPLPRLVPL